MINKLTEVSVGATSLRTVVFTVGHFFIDFFVIAIITGAGVGAVALASLLAPALNGVWYWIIDRWWSQKHADSEFKQREEAFEF